MEFWLPNDIWRRLLIIVAILVICITTFSCKADQSRAAAAKEIEAASESVKTTLRQLTEETGATTDWEDRLAAVTSSSIGGLKDYRIPYSSEVEDQWLTNQPILFTGQIVDVANSDNESYLVEIRHIEDRVLQGNFVIVMNCPKAVMNPILKTQNQVSRDGGYAVAVKVERVTRSVRAEPSRTSTVFTGQGRCLSIRQLVRLPSLFFP